MSEFLMKAVVLILAIGLPTSILAFFVLGCIYFAQKIF